MIVHNSTERVTVNGVLYSNPETIRALGIALMINMAEGHTDMICDMPEEYTTKAEIEAVYKGLNEVALDMLEDNLYELGEKLKAFLRDVKYTARVRGIEYDRDGRMSDVTVDIDVE